MQTKHLIFIISLVVSLVGCATQQQVVWDNDGKSVVTQRKFNLPRISADRTEGLTNHARTPAEIHSYDIGRLPRGDGGMDEAHRYYRVVQSDHWDLRLPKSTSNPTGPKTVFDPPTYVPPPQSDRINNAVNQARYAQQQALGAKQKFEQAAQGINQRFQEDNNLRSELQHQMEINQRLRDQIEKGFGTQQNSSPSGASPSSSSSKNDPLLQWGKKIDGQQ